MKSSNWTGRTARTMQEALGPYTDHKLAPMKPEKPSMIPWLIWGAIFIAVSISIIVYEVF